MKEITRKISLDLSRKSNVKFVFASQADAESRTFLISLFDDGAPYRIGNGITAAVNVLRADETSSSFLADVTDEGCVKYTAGAWALGVAGITQFSVSLYDANGGRLTSSSFTVNIAPGLYLGEDIDGNDEVQSAFAGMMEQLTSNNAELISATNDARDAADSANKSADSASEAALSAEDAAKEARDAARDAADATALLDEALEDMLIRPIEKGGTGADTAQGAVRNFKDYIFPVGAVYMSVNSASPASFIGGTWERLKDRFLLGAGDTYAAGATGGSATHTLTVNEMPRHNHKSWAIVLASIPGASAPFLQGGTTHGDSQHASTTETGGGGAHNNMPPYLAVYMWKRIA